MTTLLEPVLLVFMAVIIGFIVIAMTMPMFEWSMQYNSGFNKFNIKQINKGRILYVKLINRR